MSQLLELDNVVRKIRALLAKTTDKNCSEAEALSSAAKVGELMKTYNVSMDKVFLGEAKCITATIQTGRLRNHPILECLGAIAKFCDCKYWMSREWINGRCERVYKMFGLEMDTELAKYMFDTILRAIDTETENFKKSDIYIKESDYYGGRATGGTRRRMTISFQKGMASRIGDRLHSMRIERHREESLKTSNVSIADAVSPELSTNIVLIKQNKVENEFEKLGLKLKNVSRGYSRGHGGARSAGYAAGSRVTLNRPMNGGSIAGYLGG